MTLAAALMNWAAAAAGFFSFANSDAVSTRRLPSSYGPVKKWGSSRSAMPSENPTADVPRPEATSSVKVWGKHTTRP